MLKVNRSGHGEGGKGSGVVVLDHGARTVPKQEVSKAYGAKQCTYTMPTKELVRLIASTYKLRRGNQLGVVEGGEGKKNPLLRLDNAVQPRFFIEPSVNLCHPL